MIEYYFTAAALPLSLLIMLAGSIVIFKYKRSTATAAMLLGLIGILVGYSLQNFTPREISYTNEGHAIIDYTPLFGIGMHLSQFCMLLVAVSFFVFARSLRRET